MVIGSECTTPVTAVGNASCTYHNRGNLTHYGVYTHTWNAGGQPVDAETITHALVYAYTGDELRVTMAVHGQTTGWCRISGC